MSKNLLGGQEERLFPTERLTHSNGKARRAWHVCRAVGESVLCLWSKDERWESSGSEAAQVGRNHLRKSLVLHTRLFRLYAESNVELLKKSEQGSERLRFAWCKITPQQSGEQIWGEWYLRQERLVRRNGAWTMAVAAGLEGRQGTVIEDIVEVLTLASFFFFG